MGTATTNFVKRSPEQTMYLFPGSVSRKGPVMSVEISVNLLKPETFDY